MALLAFQGAGHTHQRGSHQLIVKRGWDYLLKQLDADGNFFHYSVDHHRLYSQAQATIAICERLEYVVHRCVLYATNRLHKTPEPELAPAGNQGRRLRNIVIPVSTGDGVPV